MTKEISKEVIVKVFGLYLGAKVETPDGTGIMHTVCQSGHIYAKCEGMQTEEYALYECQLILSDLSDISDEDSIELAKIAGVIPKGVNARVYKNTFGEPVVSWGETHYAKYRIPIKEPHLFNGAQYDFLRSRGYMLPAFGITDLFEAGIAARKNKEV